MCIAKYSDMMNVCGQIKEKTQDAGIAETAAWIRMSLEKEHKPTMALVSFHSNHLERFSFLKKCAGVEVPEKIAELFEGKSVCLFLDYYNTPVIMNTDNIAGDRIVLGLPSELLKKNRIVICDEIQSKEDWLNLSDEIDIVCLVINATMAMNQMERAWLKECAKPLFADNELIIAITKMDCLNVDEEVQSVRRIVEDGLSRLKITVKVFEALQDGMLYMETFLKKNPIQDNHDKRVARNGLTALKEQVMLLSDRVVIEEETIQCTVNQLEKQQKTLELAGQLAAESILCNALNQSKVQICESVRDYGRQMAENIHKKVENSPPEQLETMDERIKGYISGSWEYYLNSMSSKMDTEVERVVSKLTKQMEIDAGTLITNLDESAKRTVYDAISLKTVDRVRITDYENMNHDGCSPADISAGAISERLRKETRNMMLLSVPLFFVNPFVSVGNIFAARLLGKMRINNELKNVRTEFAGQIENICSDNAEMMVLQIENSFNDMILTGVLNVKAAYANLIQQIKNDLIELKLAQRFQADLKEYLKAQEDEVFPRLIAGLQ